MSFLIPVTPDPSAADAVIRAVPGERVFTRPFWSTVATLVSLDCQTTCWSAFAGFTAAVNSRDRPGFAYL